MIPLSKKIDLGSGLNPAEGYEHLDINPKSPHLEYENDVRDLPFEDDSIDELRASHILEHISYTETTDTLIEWFRVLKPKGFLTVISPNIEGIIRNYEIHGIDNQETFEPIYGTHTTEWDSHEAGLTPEIIIDKLKKVGFEKVINQGSKYSTCNIKAQKKHASDLVLSKSENLKWWLDIAYLNSERYSPHILNQGIIEGFKSNFDDVIVTNLEAEDDPNPSDPVPDDVEERMCLRIPAPYYTAHRRAFPRMLGYYFQQETAEFPSDRINALRVELNNADFLALPNTEIQKWYKVKPIDTPTFLLQEGIDRIYFNRQKRDYSDKFNILSLGLPSTRKGTWMVLEAFKRVFNEDDNAHLYVLANQWYDDFEYHMKEHVTNPDITFIQEYLSQEELRSLYYKSHLGVSMSLSEAFDLMLPEAMSTGLPCAVSRVGGHLDYFTEDCGWWINFSTGFIPISRHHDNVEGFWQVPDRAHLERIMRYAYQHHEECITKGNNASEQVQSLTWENAVANFSSKLLEEFSG